VEKIRILCVFAFMLLVVWVGCKGISLKKGESSDQVGSTGQKQQVSKVRCIDFGAIDSWANATAEGGEGGYTLTLGTLGPANTWYAACLYTVEGRGGGGNNYETFLALFELSNNGNGSRVPVASEIVGGKMIRAVHSVQFGAGYELILSTTEYSERDATCCPSIPAYVNVELKRTTLVISTPHKREG
jgi:hypothetical protein